jgi:hypothetical protein
MSKPHCPESAWCDRLAAVCAIAGAVATLAAAPVFGAACDAKSGPQAVPLVELYTSEGCSSCPPADRWLSSTFGKGAGPAAGIALAFHVDYWDRLGWTDRFASPAYTERQYDGMRANRARFVYTPQVLVQGRDFPEWHDRRPCRARIGGREARACRDRARSATGGRHDRRQSHRARAFERRS